MNAKLVQITVRILAGLAGGYILSAAVAVFVAKHLPAYRLEAVLTGWMFAIVLQCFATISAFAAATALRGCLWIGVPAAVFCILNLTV